MLMSGVGIVMMYFFGKTWPACILFAMAGIVLISAFFLHALYDGFERCVTRIVFAAGVALTWILLVPFFFLCFASGHLILWLRRKDPLNREFPTNEQTYWTPRAPVDDLESYKRQY